MILLVISLSLYLTTANDYGCKALVYLARYRVFDVCFSKSEAGTLSSQMYTCKSDNSGVDISTWSNIDCSSDPTNITTQTTNTAMFDCNSASNCAYAMYRKYDAMTINASSCVIIENGDYADDFYAVDNCFSTEKWVCDATQLSFEQYYFNIVDNSQDDDDCIQAPVSTSPMMQAGCVGLKYLYSNYIEILNCSPLQPTTTITTTVDSGIPTDTIDTTSASVTCNYSSIVIVFLIVSCVIDKL